MTYALSILPRAKRQLKRLGDPSYSRIVDGIRSLTANPRPHGCRKLTGRDGYRIRVGDYRVIYEVDDSARQVLVLDIGHRKDIYR